MHCGFVDGMKVDAECDSHVSHTQAILHFFFFEKQCHIHDSVTGLLLRMVYFGPYGHFTHTLIYCRSINFAHGEG